MRKLLLPLVLVTASCAQPRSHIDADQAIGSYTDCLHVHVSSIDDLYSEAYAVAKALASKCYAPFQAAMEAAASDAPNERARRMFIDRSQKQNHDFALNVVLQYRKHILSNSLK